jgi:hypothetical protein
MDREPLIGARRLIISKYLFNSALFVAVRIPVSAHLFTLDGCLNGIPKGATGFCSNGEGRFRSDRSNHSDMAPSEPLWAITGLRCPDLTQRRQHWRRCAFRTGLFE